ncbi:TPA: ribosome assembly factor SBDS [archaeon]|uniref:Ribosome assembly factor SBDS n=1 Tax=Candidatus Naiadarchaeum limnaeum TaxID=2756139 RepID=A0A832V465_9ARCH|nr:ribosome assembly factor SBDS [Candidatus Naiadarchaeum limnaeum]
MVSIDKAVLARLSKAGKHFEIYVDPQLALEVKHGKELDMRSVLASPEVFKDAKKGDKAAESSIKETFGTTDSSTVAKEIIRKGELQLTTDQRRHMSEEKKRAIIAKIAREAYNPQTKTPHPPSRIEKAIEESHISIDPFESVDAQASKVVKAIRQILPISIETFTIEVLIPNTYSGSAYGALKKYGMEREEWLSDGSLRAIVKIPAGIEADFYSEINGICKGAAQFTRLKEAVEKKL